MVNDMAAIATAYDAKTGDVLWQGRLGEAARESFSASPRLRFGNESFGDSCPQHLIDKWAERGCTRPGPDDQGGTP